MPFEPHRLRLDGNPALPFEVHGVEDLVAELPIFDRPAALDEAVGERRLAVVDVGDDAEVAEAVLRDAALASGIHAASMTEDPLDDAQGLMRCEGTR